MNNRSIFIITAVVALTCSARTRANEMLFETDFESTQVDSVPEELMVLAGQFSVREIGGNRVLELPGNPLEDFGALFGPAQSDAVAVRARIRSESTKRLAPRFGVGLCGVAGYRLLVAPGQNGLQLLKDQQVLAAAPFDWKSGTWTSLHLQVRKVSEGKWIIEGRAWAEGTSEPKEWSISAEVSEALPAGKASIWGAPYSGKPILFDDLNVIPLQP
ncbi:MAG: hypothetical protein WBL40_05225 [Terrimicrobiaceae bacterium]